MQAWSSFVVEKKARQGRVRKFLLEWQNRTLVLALRSWRERERDPAVCETMDRALSGLHSQYEFAPLQPFQK